MKQRNCLVCGKPCGIWLFDTKACQAAYDAQHRAKVALATKQQPQPKQPMQQQKVSKPKQLSFWSETE